MSTFTYLVNVTTERESGLIASNDEQDDFLQNQITEAIESEAIDGIGARSDSTYNVTDVSIESLSRKDERDVRAEYEATVRAQEPSDTELRAELKTTRTELARALTRIQDLENAATKRKEAESLNATRIYQVTDRTIHGEERQYFSDGPYDFVCFQVGPNWGEVIEVGFSKRGNTDSTLEIRAKDGYLSILPASMNMFYLHQESHHA